MYNLGFEFAKLIQQEPQFELAVTVNSNSMCFKYGDFDLDLDKFHTLSDDFYRRTTIMNTFTTLEHLKQLLAKIKRNVVTTSF